MGLIRNAGRRNLLAERLAAQKPDTCPTCGERCKLDEEGNLSPAALTAVEELLSLYPGFTRQIASEELLKWNFPPELIERYVKALRKASVPGEPRV